MVLKDAFTLALGTQEHTGRVRGMGTRVTHTSFFQTPTLYRRPQQADQQKVIEDLHKQWEERFQNQEKKSQEMMTEMYAKYQNATSGLSYASQSTPPNHSPRRHKQM